MWCSWSDILIYFCRAAYEWQTFWAATCRWWSGYKKGYSLLKMFNRTKTIWGSSLRSTVLSPEAAVKGFTLAIRTLFAEGVWFSLETPECTIVRSVYRPMPSVLPAQLPKPFKPDIYAAVYPEHSTDPVFLELPTFSQGSHILFKEHLQHLLPNTPLPQNYRIEVQVGEQIFMLDETSFILLKYSNASAKVGACRPYDPCGN